MYHGSINSPLTGSCIHVNHLTRKSTGKHMMRPSNLPVVPGMAPHQIKLLRLTMLLPAGSWLIG